MTVPEFNKNHIINLSNNTKTGLRPTLLALAVAQALTLSAGWVPSAQAATIVVNNALDTSADDAICTLREAVSSINVSSVAGTGCVNSGIGFGANDQINFSVATVSLSNGYLRAIKDLSINGGNAGVTISGDGDDRLFRFNVTDTDITLNNLTLSGGGGGDGDGDGAGGAIYAEDVNLSLNHCTVSGNTATYGGGISMNNSTVILSNSTVSGNAASFSGGGGLELYNGGNNALYLINSTVSDNTAASGGGGIVASNGGVVVLISSTLSGNTTPADGGGMALTESIAYLVNSTVSGNSATNGGGVSLAGYNAVFVTSTTVANNTASDSGGGIFMAADVAEGGMVLYNSIIANSAGGDCHKNSGNIVTNTQSIIEDGSCDTLALSVDPLLGPLADNGGPTKTHALLRGSPAINTGSNEVCAPTELGSGKDQRGERRPARGICDIGAYEFGAESTPFVIPLSNGKAISFDL